MARTGQEVLLVRHGETEWSRSGQHTSRTDIPLIEEGRERALQLGRRLAERRFSLILSSPLRRAYDTAKLAGLADDAEVTDDLVEFGYGEYEGRTTPEIREERPGWNLWTDGSPGGEDLADASARADRVIERALAAGRRRRDVRARTHPADRRRALGRLPPETAAVLALSTAALCILGFERERRVIWLWNDTSHAT